MKLDVLSQEELAPIGGPEVPYCEGRLFYDADSHIMETADWLSRHVDPEFRDAIPPMVFERIGSFGEAIAQLRPDGSHEPDVAARLEGELMERKGYEALGASNAVERSRAIDLLGVEAQIIFSGLSVTQFLYHDDLDVKYAGARAHNRAMAEFCAHDARMLGVGLVPLHDPLRALGEAQYAIDLGCKAFWIRAMPDGDRSPGHPDLDPFWACLEEAGTPFIVHIGAQGQQIRTAYMNNGLPLPKDFLGGGEVMRAKDYTTFHQLAESFLSVLVLDGVLDRFPRLRGAAIEMGATWVPGFLARLDNAVKGWGRSEPRLKEFARSPRDMAIDQLTFTTLPFENVGDLIRASSPDIYMFGTDYPHIEGSKDPLGRMLATLEGIDEETLQKFFSRNFAKMMGLAPVAV
jgi:predicted TIM-barrel fold metal-dependent hydrolase